MKLISAITIIFSILSPFLLPAVNYVAANSAAPKSQTVQSYKEDLTGDGKTETIFLKAIPFSKDSAYFQKVWANITSSESKKWTIPYEGGYEPKLQFYDLNHDMTLDVYYQSSTGGSGGLYHSQLNTLENGKLIEIPLPEQHYIKGEFIEGFKASLSLSPGSKSIIMDVKNRSDDYTRLGIYNKQGNLLKSTPLLIDPIAFYEPILISKSKGYGLKSYQQIYGAYHADQLGTIETIWYYEAGRWIIITTKWVPSE
ncbi:hypothetical protein [Virgibacillus sp. DJP39]|uniref:hypothetical protein n=1 Tax=Virgibacillus sp. DJP39 TaxID=3409790 RepID=UPI003BB70D21